jgi:hypothetical protein
MSVIESDNFAIEFPAAAQRTSGQQPTASDDAARLEQWRRDEWHGWFRWRVCRSGFDWSKPVWILLLAAGFAGLIYYGYATNKLFVTAGGVVLWFTIVNLAFFTYFGLQLPGPPRTVPGPFPPGQKLRAQMGLYPAGYERRKLARVWLRIDSDAGKPWLLELPFPALPAELQALLLRQQAWRIQRADAPLTDTVVETLPVTREQINAGAHPVRVIAWHWDEQKLRPFGRGS